MANETTWSLITSLTPVIWQSALYYAQHTSVMPQRIRVFNDRLGMVDRKVSEYSEGGGVSQLAETDDLTATQFDRALLSTLSPQEFGKQIKLTDQRLESDPENTVVDAARDLGYALGRKMEQDIIANFDSLTGGTIGDGSAAFALAELFKARSLLEASAINGPYIAVIHPYHYLDVFQDLITLSDAAPFQFREDVTREYYLPGIADVRIAVSSLVPRVGTYSLEITGSPTGGTYTISFNGETTSTIAYNASASTIETALEALSNVDTSVSVTGSGGSFTVDMGDNGEYPGDAGLSADGSNLTGGSSPDATVTADSYSSHAALFTSDAMALDMRRGIRLERQRDASARSWELNATTVYATGTWRPTRGIVMDFDASTPS